MKKVPKLSVIIVTFNSASFILPCIRSVYEGGYPKGNVEVIVIDNASSDATVTKVSKNFPEISCIKNKSNMGFAAANNMGVKKSVGEYVLILNPDTIVGKETLTTMVSFMQENKTAGVATCKVILPNGVLDDASHRGFPTPLNAFFHFIGFASLFPNSQFFNGYHLGYKNIDRIHEIDSCVGAFMLIRRSIGESIDWLDEDYFWYGEDIDFCFRVKQKGWKVYYVPTCKITHYKGASSGLKNHSRHVASATTETKILASKARFDVMETFYRKHYQEEYPNWLMRLVFIGITVKRWWVFRFMHI